MQKVYAVRDVKADSFGSPICCPTDGLATRAFADACADPRSPMAQYPEDYSLYQIGSFDPSAGKLDGVQLPVLVCSAVEVLAMVKRQAAAAEARAKAPEGVVS